MKSTQSFYKIHTVKRTWQNAMKTCSMEGASLFYPQDKNEADMLAQHLKQTHPSFSWLYVAASDVLANGVYETIYGVPVMNTYQNWAPEEPTADHRQNCLVLTREGTFQDEDCTKAYSFACKKTLSTLQWNKRCNTPYKDYEYDEYTGHCYKFHLNPRIWSDAHATCNAELSYLAVINSPIEANILVNISAKATKDEIENLTIGLHIGFQKFASNEGWITVKGIPLRDSGYTRWNDGEPNNAGGDENCGSMSFTGKLNDDGCNKLGYFICEHDVDTTTSDETVKRGYNEYQVPEEDDMSFLDNNPEDIFNKMKQRLIAIKEKYTPLVKAAELTSIENDLETTPNDITIFEPFLDTRY